VTMMNTTAFTDIKATSLARAAGVSRATFYRYFTSVDEVLKELETEFLERLRDINRYTVSTRLNKADLSQVIDSYDRLFEFIHENRDFYLAIHSPHGDPQFRYREHQLIREIYLAKLMYDGFDVSSKPLDLSVTFALAGHDALVEHWLRSRPDIPPHEIISLIQRLMFGIFLL